MQKALVHIMTKARMRSDVFSAEIDNMEDLSEKHGVINFIYYKGEEIEYKDFVNKLEKLGIVLNNYSNREELKEKVLELSKEYDIAFVSTPMELLVNVMNDIKLALGHSLSDNPEVFRNKHLQRQLIQNYNPELGVKFMKGEPSELHIEEIEEMVGYPFIIKPVDGLQSSGVEKIENRDDFNFYMRNYQVMHDRLKSRGIDNKVLIVEEYIDGKMYSIDYFVTPEGEAIISKPVKVRLGIDYGFDDYCCTARISSEKTEKEFKGKRVKTFINSTIKATGIRNTFVHHELKINSKGEIKTIELNGRLGGGRLEVIRGAYDLNLYELIFNYDAKPGVLKYNNIAINIYATKAGILTSFNQKLLEKIRKRETVYNVELEECCVGKEIGLTKDGFVKVGVIKMQHKDYKLMRKDYLFVKRHYAELLEIEEV